MRFTARPRMGDGGASRRMRWHRGDPRRGRPLMGSRPAPPLRGRAVTVSKFLCEGRLQGVSYLINGFGGSIKHAIKSPGNCFGQVWGFLSRTFFFTRATLRPRFSGLLVDLKRPLR